MLVGKVNVELAELERRAKNSEEFIKYSDSLISEELKHIKGIVDNQRYLCCLLLRKSGVVDWPTKRALIDKVLPDVKIIGYTDTCIEVKYLLSLVDRDRMIKFKRRS